MPALRVEPFAARNGGIAEREHLKTSGASMLVERDGRKLDLLGEHVREVVDGAVVRTDARAVHAPEQCRTDSLSNSMVGRTSRQWVVRHGNSRHRSGLRNDDLRPRARGVV